MDNPESDKIVVNLEFDPDTNHLSIHSPDNYHRTLAIMRLAEAQLTFAIANQVDAARAAQHAEQHDQTKIRVVRDMPSTLKH